MSAVEDRVSAAGLLDGPVVVLLSGTCAWPPTASAW